MLNRKLSALILITFSSCLIASDEAESSSATKLEAFQARTGTVNVRGYTTVGTLRGLGANVSVDARAFKDASDLKVSVKGISITIKETSRLERQSTSFIDSDEIPSLLSGIDYISKVNSEITDLERFEVDYRTNGDFRVSVFSNSNGEISAALSSGRVGRVTTYIKLADLAEFKKLILEAQAKL